MDAFKHNAKNKELANSLLGNKSDDARIHRTMGGFIGGAGSIGLPMLGEALGGPLGGVAGNILGMAAQHIGNQMDGQGSGSGPRTDNVNHGFKPRFGTFNIEGTARANRIAELEQQTGVKSHAYNGPATNTFDDDAVAHDQNEIERLQTIGQNNEMRQELMALRQRLGMRPDSY